MIESAKSLMAEVRLAVALLPEGEVLVGVEAEHDYHVFQGWRHGTKSCNPGLRKVQITTVDTDQMIRTEYILVVVDGRPQLARHTRLAL